MKFGMKSDIARLPFGNKLKHVAQHFGNKLRDVKVGDVIDHAVKAKDYLQK
jgi:hypothetical protein